MKKRRYGLILLLLAIFGWFAGVRPQMKVFETRSLDHKIKLEEVRSYDQRLKDIELIKAQGEAVQQNLRALYLALPRSAQVPEVLVMIESMASASGVVLSGATVGNPNGKEVPVTLSFSGNLASVTQFLDTIYNNIRTASVKSQTLSSDSAGVLTMSLQLGLVYQGGP